MCFMSEICLIAYTYLYRYLHTLLIREHINFHCIINLHMCLIVHIHVYIDAQALYLDHLVLIQWLVCLNDALFTE